jgi:peptidoglycan/LPS O-acetylase OafA/YrhL
MVRESHHSRHFLGLDGLRGVAAFVVVFLHGTMVFDVGYIPPAACLAVDFFFLLSGFVVAYAYDERLANGSMTWRQFMVVRMIRLYPMVFVGTAVGAALRFRSIQFDPSTFLMITAGSFALLPVGFAVGAVAYPLNLPVWSLFFEFAINALYGSRFGKLGMRSLTAFVAVSAVALIPMALWGAPYVEIGWKRPITFGLGFVRVAYPFAAGVLLFRVSRFRTIPGLPIGPIGCLLALLLLMPVNNTNYDLVLVLAVFPVLTALGSRASFGKSAALVCSAFGRLSYPLYLVHMPVFLTVQAISLREHIDVSPWVPLICGAVVSVIAAEMSLILFDEPVRLWLMRRWRRPMKPIVEPST